MIQLADKTAWLGRADTGEIHIVQYDGTLDSLLALLKVEMIDTIRLDRKNIIFVDDEGWMKELPINGFTICYKNQKPFDIAGNFLITGDDEMGGNCAVSFGVNDIKISSATYGKKEA